MQERILSISGWFPLADMRPELLAHRLESDRLVLRDFEPRDAAALFRVVDESRAHLEQWLVWPKRVASEADAALWIEETRCARPGGVSFGMGMFAKASAELVGAAGLRVRGFDCGGREHQWLDIGYWTGVRATRRGYACEAVRRLARHALEEVAASRVEIRIESGNAKSLAVAERAGFLREGILRNTIFRDGLLRHTVVFSLAADEIDRVR